MGSREEAYLYHGTSAAALAGILREGMSVPSWGSKRMAEHWAEVHSDGQAMVLVAKRLADFDPEMLFWDDLMAQEPVWFDYVVEADRDAVVAATEGTWKESLAILESVVYGLPMAVDASEVRATGVDLPEV